MQDKKYRVWLSSLPGVGSRRFKALMEYFRSAENVFRSTRAELIASNTVTEDVVDSIVNNRNIEKLDNYLKKVKENDIKVYTIEEEEYPENLKNIYDPPPVLYVRGTLTREDSCSVGIVGSRKASDYGLKTAERLAIELAEAGVTIVSGMALGIDSAAHRGAIKAGGRTIAVFACGLSNVYPQSGTALSREIIKNGAIISEYPIGMKAVPQNFPARNRIISGMSKGVLVVEAGQKSGSLITSDFALEQGRDVFAIPGNINSPGSKGTHNLIKNGAKLVDSVEDILEELHMLLQEPGAQEISDRELPQDLDEAEAAIIKCLLNTGRNINEIILDTGYPAARIISAVTMLELKGLIQQSSGIFFICQAYIQNK